jgi:hypothetical protein
MQGEKDSAVTLVVETQPPLPSFLEEKVDLRRLARDISRASSKAVDILIKLLDSKDEKIQLEAAKKLVEFQVQVAKEISTDQMQRLIAEIKLVRAPQQKLVPADDGDAGTKRPVVDFTTIRAIS